MRIRRQLAVAATAALAFWAPSIVPALTGDRGGDAAYAQSAWRGWAPWTSIYVMAGAGSVMANAAWVWRTQCRELSSREAMTSAALPIFGIAFDAQASKCRR